MSNLSPRARLLRFALAWCLWVLLPLAYLVSLLVSLLHKPPGCDASFIECFLTIPVTAQAAAVASLLMLAFAAVRYAAFARRLLARARAQRKFLALASPSGGLNVVKSDARWAGTFGLLRNRIFATTALVELLTPEERAALLAHENAHIARRHSLLSALAGFLLAPMPLTDAWREAFTASLEIEADAEALTTVSSKPLARAIVFASEPLSGALDLAGGPIENRVRSILRRRTVALRSPKRALVGLLLLPVLLGFAAATAEGAAKTGHLVCTAAAETCHITE